MDLLSYALAKQQATGGVDLSDYATKTEVAQVRTYKPFPTGWNAKATSSYTTKQFCDAVNADSNAVEGTVFLGEIRCSDLSNLPGGVSLVNGEAVVEIIKGTGTSGKTIHISLTSGNRTPYRWEYTYWNNGSSTSGWKGFYPIYENGIPKADLSTEVQNLLDGKQYVTAGQKAGTTLGERATAEGLNTTASAAEAHAEGTTTEATGPFSHAEGSDTKATSSAAHAEGRYTEANGTAAHAEGDQTKALGNGSHAEGNNTKASGLNAHAEGNNTEASGNYTHAEGISTSAEGLTSHAEGYGTIARFKSSHVFGEYNQIDEYGINSAMRGRYVEIVGNGTNANSRSNARTLTWTGDETLKGTLTVSSAGITIGNTTISEEQLQALLALLPIDQGGNEVTPPDESGSDQGGS